MCYHRSVLLDETISFLQVRPEGVYVDATLGGGGHALEIARLLEPGGRLVGLDQDPAALEAAAQKLDAVHGNISLIRANFSDVASVLRRAGLPAADGILFDLGVSSHQLDTASRGFSFRDEAAPLDMRMDPSLPFSAADLANSLSERELSDMLFTLSEESWARRIARGIALRRQIHPIRTAGDLTDIVMAAIPKKAWPRDIHPATRTYMAFRIRVNREMEALEQGLQEAVGCLAPGGRVCAISYHSLEDRIVKNSFTRLSGKCQCPPQLPVCACGAKAVVKILTRKPVTPSAQELADNPRSRSAKLRAAEKI
ncbi:MAG: 16S rRNA (cytosine(1402)-N(4))-methyltransferase RsmH [Armatimonadetes bacterium]|nr:16S rRNA (cytosine(1402)-N(4))-methyltransferase RsmH [Armatimonadota bacterium]